MKTLSIKNLNLRLKEFYLKDINLEVAENEFMVILGPTGAGKTVLLETIAGFHNLDSGKIFLQEAEISNFPPEKRGVGIIFQDYALFPHLTIRQNILFGSRYQQYDNLEETFDKLVDLLKLRPLLDRLPQTLSGGEQQRVGIARAMITQPTLLLFDEPMSALDERLRIRLREELKAIIKELNQTSIYVTHDQLEAAVIGDRVAIMEQGELLQVGSPEEIFYQPKNKKVAEFTGVETVISGRVKNKNQGMAIIDINNVEIEAITSYEVGSKVIVCIRSENIGLSLEDITEAKTSVRNRLRGKITRITPLGPVIKVTLDCGFPLITAITKRSFDILNLVKGETVTASFKAVAVHVI